MRIIGLTGGIGCGKSLVSKRFQDIHGFAVIDCDKISHQILLPGNAAFKRIVEQFGRAILLDNGSIDRKALGEVVFNDKSKLKILTGITGPVIFLEIVKKILYNFLVGTPIVILDAPTLYETKKLVSICAAIVVVGCDEDEQVKRVMKRDGLDKEEVLSRMSNQIPTKEKANMSDFVIWNNGTKEEAFEEIDRLAGLLRNKYHGISRLVSVPGIALLILVAVFARKVV